MASQPYHVPVLLEEAVSYLIGNTSGVFLDCTLGGGGHSEQILRKLTGTGKLIALDRDWDAIEYAQNHLKRFEQQLTIVQGDFANIDDIVEKAGHAALDGILLDLGISSHQIDVPSRGFSYLQNGPLDMRMNLNGTITACDVIQTYSETSLADLFFYYGEERKARQIARRIVLLREKETITTTQDLARVVRMIIPAPVVNKSLARIFQALRIEVNDELEQLKKVLLKAEKILKTGGRLVIISYHSLEDRLVKRFIRGEPLSFKRQDLIEQIKIRQFKMLHKKVIQPTEEEMNRNPRARSARLRAAERIQN